MTREDAMDLVISAFDAWEYNYGTGDDWSKEHEARDMAIKALEKQDRIAQILDDYDYDLLDTWEALKMVKEVMKK